MQKSNLQLQAVGRHFIRQLQLLTVKKGAEDVLVKVEGMLDLVSGCSQIDPFAFLSLIGLTVLLAWLDFF